MLPCGKKCYHAELNVLCSKCFHVGPNVVMWLKRYQVDPLLSCGRLCYHVELMLPSVANLHPAFFLYFDIPKLANVDRALTWTLILCINLLNNLIYTYSLLTLICAWKCRFCFCLLANHPIGLQRKSHLCIPFLRFARPQSQSPHSCVCERFIYS